MLLGETAAVYMWAEWAVYELFNRLNIQYSQCYVYTCTSHNNVLFTQQGPNLEGQVPVFISPRNRVAQLYPRALG
jgi:hypothetical protein